MPDMPSARLEHLFIVRLWQESGREESGAWRGLVEHVQSGQRLYFTTLADLNDFIALRMDSSRMAEDKNSGCAAPGAL